MYGQNTIEVIAKNLLIEQKKFNVTEETIFNRGNLSEKIKVAYSKISK